MKLWRLDDSEFYAIDRDRRLFTTDEVRWYFNGVVLQEEDDLIPQAWRDDQAAEASWIRVEFSGLLPADRAADFGRLTSVEIAEGLGEALGFFAITDLVAEELAA